MRPPRRTHRGRRASGNRLRLTAWFLMVLASASGLWYGLRSAVSLLAPGLLPPFRSRWLELVVYGASLLAFGLLGRLIHVWHSEDPFVKFSEALSRIARGDFDTAVELPKDAGPHSLGKFAGEINDMARSLKRMEELRQEFIATVSHDIQSPLTSITGFAKALRNEGLAEATRVHYLDIIEAESARLSRLSADLLRLTTLEAQEMAPALAFYPLDHQLREVVLSLEPQWRVKHLELDLELDSVRIQADADLLAQVWANLLHNACKFSSPGGSLGVTLQVDSGLAKVKVMDSGAGIAAEDLPRVFDRFFKADPARTPGAPESSSVSSGSGSGLGLAIAQKIVTLHGGSIHAESDGPGRGTTLVVELPLEARPMGTKARE